MKRPSRPLPRRGSIHPNVGTHAQEEARESVSRIDADERAVGALRRAYEAVHHILGARRFADLALAYAEKHPTRSPELETTGRHFESFLKKAPISRQFKFLSDLAHLEWQIVEAFTGSQGEPAGVHEMSRLKQTSTDKIRIEFQPTVSVFQSRWPIFDIWQARKKPLRQIRIHLANRAQNVLVYRSGEHVRVECVDDRQYLFLDELLRGHTLGKACETLVRRYSKERIPLAEWFAHWMRSGIFSGF